MDLADFKDIENVPFISMFPEANVRSAMQYEPQANDVIIVTYPKCGTTWVQYIVTHILTKEEPPRNPAEFMLCSPLMELMGAESATRPERKGPLITHLPLSNIRFSERVKYIYIARNPYDCSISCYCFYKGVTSKRIKDVSFGTFLERFHTGKILCGGYFDHLIPWYAMRNEPNVLFITYEQLKRNTGELALKIADFLGEEHGKALRDDKKFYEKVLQSSSLTNMKMVFHYSPAERVRALAELPPEKSMKSLTFFKDMCVDKNETHEGAAFVRKGNVGDWRSHYTAEHIASTKAWIAEKTEGCDVMDLWKDLELP